MIERNGPRLRSLKSLKWFLAVEKRVHLSAVIVQDDEMTTASLSLLLPAMGMTTVKYFEIYGRITTWRH